MRNSRQKKEQKGKEGHVKGHTQGERDRERESCRGRGCARERETDRGSV